MELKIFLEEYNPQLENNFLSNEERLRLIKIYDSLEDKPEAFDDWLLEHTPPETIDYVIPFVDPTDVFWKKAFFEKLEESETKFKTPEDIDDSKELLKYHLRGISKYLPWLGIIHIVVAYPSQVPDWLDCTKVHIAYYKEFIPESYLPTFNKNTIEMFLHRIAGLSENFIYGLDDRIWVVNPLEPKHFFREKRPVYEVHYDDDPSYVNAKNQDSYLAAIKLLDREDEWLKKVIPVYRHMFIPLQKSMYKSFYETYKNTFLYNITPFPEKFNNSIETFKYLFLLKGYCQDLIHNYNHLEMIHGSNISRRNILRMADLYKAFTPLPFYFKTIFEYPVVESPFLLENIFLEKSNLEKQ